MAKGLRLWEKWFQRGLWLIAVLFAALLIGLGSLVVGDLPKVEKPVDLESFTDRARLVQEREEVEADQNKIVDLNEQRTRAEEALNHARAATESERDNFQTWISTRSATQQNGENPEVLKRTRALEETKAKERDLEQKTEALETQNTTLEQDQAAHQKEVDRLTAAGQAGYDRAVSRSELRVFGMRLLLTLPLLLLAVWLFVKRRNGPRWPFVWGFAFFAAFTFFFELVPYLPSYGGYLRYLVGLALTVWAGNYAIGSLRKYLETQKAREKEPEQERRKDLGYETAQIRLARKICPACERPLDTADASNNFCMNCGLLVFAPCPRCSTRQTTFSHFCRACGLQKQAVAPEEPTPPAPLQA